ncbi:M1 family metallopeptidase [Streptomyces sp. LD120]|uniref:Aminopeptidase N n=1 Tax=Streptomyces physcomitrii TaxID=2724184 RepID=A0ABX1H7G4_9ACTN|nr:M1 family metallopeptidase [Streptomyces physcomitrii]
MARGGARPSPACPSRGAARPHPAYDHQVHISHPAPPGPRPPRARRPHRRTAASAALLLLAGVLGGCGGRSHGEEAPARPGAAGVGDPYFPQAGNGGFDVRHYALRLGYTPRTERLTGTAVLTARAEQALSSFHLDLRGLRVSEVEVNGARARSSRRGQELLVRPARPLPAGREFTTRVRYAGRPLTLTQRDGSQEGWVRTEDGAVALGEPVGGMTWFPGSHHPSDKASYDIRVTVPKGLTAVAGGELRERRTAGGRTTFRWRSTEPVASYVATVAVGRFRLSSSVLPGRGGKGGGGLPVWNAVDPVTGEAGRASVEALPKVMKWAERNFGGYPFSSAGGIVEREGDADYALETQTRPFYPGPPDEVLLVHEVAHQWYGNSVSPKTWRDMWLNESFATYAEWLWQEDHGGPSAQESFEAVHDGSYFETPDEALNLWKFPPARPPGPDRLSDAPSYEGGAMVLHRIRTVLGDRLFRRLLTGWPAAHRHGNADTRDFTSYVEKLGGPEHRSALRRVWKDWLYGTGKPELP